MTVSIFRDGRILTAEDRLGTQQILFSSTAEAERVEARLRSDRAFARRMLRGVHLSNAELGASAA